MKKILGIAILLVPALALGAISTTKHNLSSASTATIKNTETGQICVFCHIPHKAITTQRALWNRATPATTTYTSWGAGVTNFVNGTAIPVNIGTSSLRCFSCHDGTSNIMQVANYYNAATGALVTPKTFTFTAGGNLGAGGNLTGGLGLVSTANMAGNHPVSVPYPATHATGVVYNGVTSAINTAAEMTFWLATPTSPIRLYTDATGSGVECGSCHEPHDNTNAPFLRMSMNASALCLGCHQK